MAAVTGMTDWADLQSRSERLNPASDELNAAIETIQSRLNAYALGVEVWLDVDELKRTVLDHTDTTRGPSRSCAIAELGYGRIDSAWGLLVRSRVVTEHQDADGDWCVENVIEQARNSLLRASRELRVNAMEQLPRLLDAIKGEADRVLAAVERAKQLADSLK